jgi:hypothetical protein
MTEIYGQTKADKLAEENNIARKIVSEISNYGVSDRQRWLIIYYLALEIENVDKMQETCSFLKEINPEINLTKIYEGNG